jgi:hypothetical protein
MNLYYLVKTATWDVTYKLTNSGLLSYMNTDWDNDQDSKKSTDIYLFFCSKTLLINHLNINKLLLCLLKAEYITEIQTTKKAIWLCCFLCETGFMSWILSLLRLTIRKQLSCLKPWVSCLYKAHQYSVSLYL